MTETDPREDANPERDPDQEDRDQLDAPDQSDQGPDANQPE